MKLVIEQDRNLKETEIVIRCSVINSELQKIIDAIKICSFTITAYKDGYLQKINHLPHPKIAGIFSFSFFPQFS